MKIIDGEAIRKVATWPLAIEAIRDGHRRPKAKLGDTLLESAGRKMLVRSAWIEGLGAGVKAVTVFPQNTARTPPLPSIQGQVLLFGDDDGAVVAVVDGEEVTKWKTAADSALGSDLLSRRDSETLVMIGAGSMAEPLIRAHVAVRPSLSRLIVWNRTPDRAVKLLSHLTDLDLETRVSGDLDHAVGRGDIVCSATMSDVPLIRGATLKEGCHVDLVGAYTPLMREADDEALTRGRVFVDSYETTLDHIGELKDPIARGIISRNDVLADFYALVAGEAGRVSDADITLFKNGGGAHMDVMIAKAMAAAAG